MSLTTVVKNDGTETMFAVSVYTGIAATVSMAALKLNFLRHSSCCPPSPHETLTYQAFYHIKHSTATSGRCGYGAKIGECSGDVQAFLACTRVKSSIAAMGAPIFPS